MGKINIKRAIKSAKERGIDVNCSALAEELWGESKGKTAKTNLSNLLNGKTKKINIDAVPYLCERLQCSADYLFGLTDDPNGYPEADTTKDAKKAKIETNLALISKKLSTIGKTLMEL